jgi:TRAP-type C4-dicarboxylate transport system permease large subunit
VLRESIRSTIRLTSMLLFIVLGAQIFSFAVFTWGITQDLADLVLGLDVAPVIVLLVIVVIYLILGMFLDSISVMVLTLAIVHPILTSIGYDSIWFGVVLVILLEVGLITPPVGMNLFTIQALAPGRIALGEVAWGALPFVGILLLGLTLLVIFPELALWLPGQMR